MNSKIIEKEIPPVRSRAYRCLNISKNYHGLLPGSPTFDAEYAKNEYPVQFDDDEHLVGVYENKFGERIFELPTGTKIWDTIVLSNQTFNLCRNGKCEEKIYFKDIISVPAPTNKEDDLILHITLPERVFDLAILYTHGENGVRKDVWLWKQFFMAYEKS